METPTTTCRCALKIREKEEIPLRFDLNRLAEQDVKTSFAVETENRFEALLEHWDESSTPNENWAKWRTFGCNRPRI